MNVWITDSESVTRKVTASVMTLIITSASNGITTPVGSGMNVRTMGFASRLVPMNVNLKDKANYVSMIPNTHADTTIPILAWI
jgi:hypothetical protein